ncbi:MAG: LPS assembly lipoprotein LptE, partial [Gammaproteobacteria bacterium]
MADLKKLNALLLVIALLAGCGYQLRGSTSLPEAMSVTYIKGLAPYSVLVTDFAHALRTRNVTITTDATAASAILNITGNNTERLVLSVDTAGNVLEYEIRQTIRFSVSGPDRRNLLPEQSITLSRSFLYTATDVLAKEREEKLVRRTLQENLVSLAMLRIASLGR